MSATPRERKLDAASPSSSASAAGGAEGATTSAMFGTSETRTRFRGTLEAAEDPDDVEGLAARDGKALLEKDKDGKVQKGEEEEEAPELTDKDKKAIALLVVLCE